MESLGDAPQADRLDLVRSTVEAVAASLTETSQIAAHSRMALRYVQYALRAARLLELIGEDSSGKPILTDLGTRVLATPRGSDAERAVLRAALRQATALSRVTDMVLGTDEPTREDIAELLLPGGMSLRTALRRASTLLAWRRYLLPSDDGTQLPLLQSDYQDLDDGQASSIAAGWETEVEELPVATDKIEAAEVPVVPLTEQSGSGPTESDSEGAMYDVRTPPQPPTDHGPPSALPDAITPLEAEPTGTAIVDESPLAPGIAPMPDEPLLSENDFAYLRRQISLGAVTLFTGAGFSLGAHDVLGRRLPTGAGLATELWEMCYPGQPYDGSSLQDLFEQASRHKRRALEMVLQTRFVVDASKLPDWYKHWFQFPWAKIYTLNVDDLELAAARHFELSRVPATISALVDVADCAPSMMPVIHLNGVAAEGPDGVTFSVDQFSERLARQEPRYAVLSAELLIRPFIFIGSPLEEPLLWQHINIRGLRSRTSDNELRAKGFLITPSLGRARVDKLREYNIIHVRGTAERFATEVLERLLDAAERGAAALSEATSVRPGDERNIIQVRSASTLPSKKTAFLLGEEPSWADIREGRAVDRDEDGPRLANLSRALKTDRRTGDPVQVLAVIATAGAGKTTLLMKAALRLVSDGVSVAWVGAHSEVTVRALIKYSETADASPVMVIDDAGRYGSQLVPMLRDLVKSDNLRQIVIALPSFHSYLLDVPHADALSLHREYIGRLTNADIDRLLAALEAEKRLGELRGKSPEERHQAFRERADRQILVAMIEATSGQRFEEKIIGEFQSLARPAQFVYAVAALATAQGYSMSKQEVLLACGSGHRELEAMKSLQDALLLIEDSGSFRVRHRVIAETLVTELAARGTQIGSVVSALCKALALSLKKSEDRRSLRRRVLTRLLNHDRLLRMLRDIDPARGVYAGLEDYLDADHHFWLQRGCLELEDGDLPSAENFLQQASALQPADPLVETALAHMELRKAIANPAAPSAERVVNKALDVLRRLIVARGTVDSYPAHVFGSQVLAWCRRAALTPRATAGLLREARDVVEVAVANHRGRAELRQLVDDLRRELLRSR